MPMGHQDDVSDASFQIESSPHNSETAYLRTKLQLAEEELESVDTDLAIILAKRSRLIININHYRTSLASCNKLPPELITEIMKLCVPDTHLLPLFNGKNDPRLPITQICSLWRRIAFRTPELWNIHLEQCPRGLINLIAAWFRQSSSTQINLTISNKLTFSTPFREHYLLKQLIIPYAHRLKSFSSRIIGASAFHSIPFDVLTTLFLQYTEPTPTPTESMVTPSLSSFHATGNLSHPGQHLILYLPRIPWEQLTSLTLNGLFSFPDACYLLVQCTSLEYCKFSTIGDDQLDTALTPIILPRLKSLEILFDTAQLFEDIFSLVMPNLSSLTTNLPPVLDLGKFRTFSAPFRKTLRRFGTLNYTRYFSPGNETPDEVLQMLPFVTHLATTEKILPFSTIVRIGTGELLPDLQVLKFRAPIGNGVEAAMEHLIPPGSSRKSQLKDIYIYTQERDDNWQRLKDLHSQGINIWIVRWVEEDLITEQYY